MRILFMGTPEFSVPVLEALVAAGHEVLAVYCQPPRRAGRGKKPRLSPVQKRAEELGLDVRHPLNFKADADVAAFEALKADVAVVVAYGLLLPQAILDAPIFGCINIHASLLPRWRGAAPIHRAIMAGDKCTGICLMQMEAGLDTGPVLISRETEIKDDDTTGTLHDRLSLIGAELITDLLPRLPLPAHPQDKKGVTYARKINKAEAQIDWAQPAETVDAQIRGLSPSPGAWTEIGGERVKVLNCKLAEGSGRPGQVLSDLTIACGSGAVSLVKLQRAGKAPMRTDDFLRGFTVSADTILPSTE